MRSSAPRWRVVYSSEKKDDTADAIVREDPTLCSDEVATLQFGDVVEQSGPSLIRGDGIVRMPVTTTVVRRSEIPESGEIPMAPNHGPLPKLLGWVTVDATALGGPIFFKPVADVDGGKRRRRRPQQQQQQQA